MIIRRPARDQVVVRIVWMSGAYTEQSSLTPIHREQDVSGYEEMVARMHELWREGYNDEQIAEQLTQEGYHSARSATVRPTSVMKLRLQRKWYRALEQMRGVDSIDTYLTVNGLAKRLAVNESTIYRLLRRGGIPAQVIKHEPQSGIYLIRKDEAVLEELQEQVAAQKRRNGMLKAAR